MAQEFKTVAELLEDPKRWTQKYYAINDEGQGCDIDDPKAVAWCLLGAIHKIYGQEISQPFLKIALPLSRKLNLPAPLVASLVDFNDHHSHAEILALVKEVGV